MEQLRRKGDTAMDYDDEDEDSDEAEVEPPKLERKLSKLNHSQFYMAMRIHFTMTSG